MSRWHHIGDEWMHISGKHINGIRRKQMPAARKGGAMSAVDVLELYNVQKQMW